MSTNDPLPEPVTTKELALANEYLHPLVPYGAVKAMREMTRRIMLFDSGKTKMSVSQASHFAQICLSARLNPFDGEIWAWVDDRGQLKIMPGRRGLLRHAHEQAAAQANHFWPRYEQITDPDKRANLRIPDGALAFEARVFDYRSTTTWTTALTAATDATKAGLHVDTSDLGSVPYVMGLGVLTASEMQTLDKQSSNKMTHVERCQKRAYMMALKQMFDLPLAGYVGNQGETMDDFVLDAEWREVKPEASEPIDVDPRKVDSEAAKSGTEALYGGRQGRPAERSASQEDTATVLLKRFIQWGVVAVDAHVNHATHLWRLSPFAMEPIVDSLLDAPNTERWFKLYRTNRQRNMATAAAAAAATEIWSLAEPPGRPQAGVA
jgi:hypothetical protein